MFIFKKSNLYEEKKFSSVHFQTIMLKNYYFHNNSFLSVSSSISVFTKKGEQENRLYDYVLPEDLGKPVSQQGHCPW